MSKCQPRIVKVWVSAPFETALVTYFICTVVTLTIQLIVFILLLEKIWFSLARKVGGSKSSYMDGCLNEESMFYKMVVKYLGSARYFKDLSINRWCTLQKNLYQMLIQMARQTYFSKFNLSTTFYTIIKQYYVK